MKRPDHKTKMYYSDTMRTNAQIRKQYCEKEEPSEKVKEYFRRKPYEKNRKVQPND